MGAAVAVSEEPTENVPVDYDERELSTDIEPELPAPEESYKVPFDPTKIDVQTRTVTVGLLMTRLQRGMLDLFPDFKRFPGIWDERTQSRLIESLLLRIPLPLLYAAENSDGSWAVVDGIQRLTTIARFVIPSEIEAMPLRLHGLEYLLQYEGFTYSELPGAMQARIDETELVIHLLRAGTPEEVMYNIFLRLNTAGQPLNRQELLHALIPGPVRDLLRDLAESEEFQLATQSSVSPERMADRELVLRFLAFLISDPAHYYTGSFENFLWETAERLNGRSFAEIRKLKDTFTRSMHAAYDIFGVHAFRRISREHHRRFPLNKALFEAEAVSLAKLNARELSLLRERRDSVLNGLIYCLQDPEFSQSISYSPGNGRYVRVRFTRIEQMLQEVMA
jgi:hypothetical protein